MNGWSTSLSAQPGMGQTVSPIDASVLPLSNVIGSGVATTGAGITAGLVSAGITLGVSAGISAVTYGITKWRQGVSRRAASTSIANEAAEYLTQNLQAYLASPRTVSDQAASINNFYLIWNQVVDACQKVGGNAGRACIEDRKEGSTKFSWGNWFTLFLDPIRNDPNVQPDPQPGQVYNEDTRQYETPAGSISIPTIGAIPSWAMAIGIAALGYLAFGGGE